MKEDDTRYHYIKVQYLVFYIFKWKFMFMMWCSLLWITKPLQLYWVLSALHSIVVTYRDQPCKIVQYSLNSIQTTILYNSLNLSGWLFFHKILSWFAVTLKWMKLLEISSFKLIQSISKGVHLSEKGWLQNRTEGRKYSYLMENKA